MTDIPSWFLNFFQTTTPTTLTSSGTADASVAIAVNPVAAKVGGTVTFTVTAGNNGPGGATGLSIAFPLGPNFSLGSVVASQGTYASDTGLWTVGAVGASQNATLTVTATVNASGWQTVGAQIVGESSSDAIITNNIASAGVLVPDTALPLNIVKTPDGVTMPGAISGDYNVEYVTAEPSGSAIILAPGYQAGILGGSQPATLVDFGSGGDFLVAASGNATLLTVGSSDTLIATAGNNVLVSFRGSVMEDARGVTGANLLWGSGGAATIYGGNGNDTAVMSDGGIITTGTGGSQVWLSHGNATINSQGADTIVAGAGAETINVGGSSGALVFGGSSQMVFNGGTGASTLVGFGASVTVNGSTGGGLFYGGSAGSNVLNGGTGPATLIGGGNGDVLIASGSGSDVLVAASGAETLNGYGSTGNVAFFGGNGPDMMVGGSGANVFTNGPAAMTIVGGGVNLYQFLAGADAPVLIQNFNAASDVIKLNGFGAGADASAFASAHNTGAGAMVTLGDGTQITFAGLAASSLKASMFT